MKKIIFILSLLILSSCQSQTLPPQKTENISNTNPSIENEKKEISWSSWIDFSNCFIRTRENYENFKQDENVKLLEKRIDIYNKDWNDDRFAWLPIGIDWYCISPDKNQFVFQASDKVPPAFARYDKTLDIIEKSSQVFPTFAIYNIFWSYDPLIQKFTKKQYIFQENEKLYLKISWVSLIRNENEAFFKQKNLDYCSNGLTPLGRKSLCFVDVDYEFDYLKNSIKESKICSYYIDDNWEKQVLEKCFSPQT